MFPIETRALVAIVCFTCMCGIYATAPAAMLPNLFDFVGQILSAVLIAVIMKPPGG